MLYCIEHGIAYHTTDVHVVALQALLHTHKACLSPDTNVSFAYSLFGHLGTKHTCIHWPTVYMYTCSWKFCLELISTVGLRL